MSYSPDMMAPCGMNCGTCIAFLRKKNSCMGCRSNDMNKPRHCITCIIINCERLAETDSRFCYDCPKYPCARLKRLDKQYITRYQISLQGNLKSIQEHGLETFIKQEQERWKCPHCGEKICIHKEECLFCNKKWRKEELSE